MKISSEILNNSQVNFGTSGARGLVTDFTPDVCMAFTAAFTSVMRSSFSFTKMAIGIDNRPSSYAIAQSCAAALIQKGIEPVYCGVLPTPALAYAAMKQDIPCIMVTGSHIPFDRNGLKFYRPDGEISKADEISILEIQESFDGVENLPELECDNNAIELYITRNIQAFDKDLLSGKRIGIYEHSSAGREIYSKIFTTLGAEVISLGRSDEFVPIDTEAVSDEDKAKAVSWSKEFSLDAIFSTDGDGDRPLVADENGTWLKGDILGVLCAKALGISAVAVPVSCNTVIELCGEFKSVARTRIGSPYVIEAFSDLEKEYPSYAGFEANGGFLLGSDVDLNDTVLDKLPTRDAVLPAIMLMSALNGKTISELVGSLPERYTESDRIKEFPTEKSKAILNNALSEGDDGIANFVSKLGFSEFSVESHNVTDGLRMVFSNGNIIHFRPSGNAPELRCYSEAESSDVAKANLEKALKNIQSI